jgi:hypothetical protein
MKRALKSIPRPAKLLAGSVFAIVAGLFSWLVAGQWIPGVAAIGGGVLGAFTAAYVLLAGYVYADARRRGMSPVAWTALVVLVPNALGFVFYFVLRKPLVHPCPRCHSDVAQDAAFCPRCGEPQLSTPAPDAAQLI